MPFHPTTSSSPTRRHVLAAGVAALAAPSLVLAQAPYPNHPVTLTHGFGAGGNADVVARLVAQKLSESLKQPVVVDIKSGAGGVIASNAVAKAAPDGYNLVMLTGAHTVSAALKKKLPYDPVKDFAFISTVSAFPFVVAVRAEHPAKNLTELIAMAKKEPGKITFTSVGVGSTQHMVGELLGSTAGVQLMHVPYRGGGAPVQAVIAGDVDVLTDTLTVASPHIKSGRLRALGVTSAAEWPTMPGVPPVSAVLSGFEVRSWLGLAAPANTPAPIIERLNADVNTALRAADLQKTLSDSGSMASPSTSADFRHMVESEIKRWHGVITKVGIPQQE